MLPAIQGYIPVYIRYGNQPLEEINPKLAEAFHEGSSIHYAYSPMNNLNKVRVFTSCTTNMYLGTNIIILKFEFSTIIAET